MKSIKNKSVIALTAISTDYLSTGCKQKPPEELPNILWITSEDNSEYFVNCYSNSFATTPNIDKLASEGFLYTQAFSAHPVSSPSRNSIIIGAFANSNGNIPMRSDYSTSEFVHTYLEYLRQAGYYCTNNSKTDYNTSSIDPNEIWDESSNITHYKNRPEGEPFFAIFNFMTSHESKVDRRQSTPVEELRHDPDEVTLPPY
jgi:N-sulfoglucosamine sulfohydrolase